MTKYLLTYHGELAAFPEDPAAFKAISDAWGEFYGSLGADLVDPGNPILGHPVAVGPGGTEIKPPHAGLTGFTVITAADAAAARAVAERCPVLALGSSVQVSELIEM